jgi:hypothetical protein
MYNVRTLGFYVYPERQESLENKGISDFESTKSCAPAVKNNTKFVISELEVVVRWYRSFI